MHIHIYQMSITVYRCYILPLLYEHVLTNLSIISSMLLSLEELYYTMEGTPGSPIFLLKSKDAQSDLKGRYQLIGVHFSNPTEDCTWSSGKKLNKQLLHKFGI